MIKIGMIDFDTSHVVAFTQRLNQINVSEEQWIDGGKVVIGCPGESILSPERIPGFTEKMRSYGVPLVDRPEKIIGKVDAVMIESVDGSVHYDRAKPFIEAGFPIFIDKPFTCSLDHAIKLAELANAKNVPIFTSSALRYGLEVQRIDRSEVIGAEVCTPASLHPRNPGMFHYGIHGVETLYALIGPGCEAVSAISNDDTDLAIGVWKDGRIGTVRGIRKGKSGFGFTVFGENSITRSEINSAFIYRELLKRVIEMFETGRSPLPISESVEIVAFIEAANESARKGGANIPLAYGGRSDVAE